MPLVINNVAYLAGGLDVATILSTFEMFNDATVTWTTEANLVGARDYGGSQSLNNVGYIYGGYNGAVSFTTNAYYPLTNTWVSKANLNTARYGLGSFALEGFIYAAGGETGTSGYNATAATERYNDAMDTWQVRGSLPAVVEFAAAFAINGHGYLAAGEVAASTNSLINRRYIEALNQWASTTGTGYAIRENYGMSLNGFGYTVGGYSTGVDPNVQRYSNSSLYYLGNFIVSDTAPNKVLLSAKIQDLTYTIPAQIRSTGSGLESDYQYLEANRDSVTKVNQVASNVFSPNSEGNYSYEVRLGLPTFVAGLGGSIWTTVATTLSSYQLTGGWHLDGYGYKYGGTNGISAQLEVEQYNDVLNIWSANPGTLNTAREADYSFALNGYGYATGGTNGSSNIAVVERYSDLLNSWSIVTSLSTAVDRQQSFALNTYGYVTGGENTGTTQTKVEQYNDVTAIWTTLASLPGAVQEGAAFALNGFGWVAGGSSSDSGHTGANPLNTTYRYNDFANTWSTLATLNSSIAELGGFSLSGYGWTAGGSGTVTTVEKYDPVLNVWFTEAALVAGVQSPVTFSFNNFGYAIDGGPTNTGTMMKLSRNLGQIVLGVTLEVR
jgi:hypothetical protein